MNKTKKPNQLVSVSEINQIMADFISLSKVKDRLVEALSNLPEETVLLSSDSSSTFTSVNLAELVEQDTERLEDFWEFLESYRNLRIIALVGMLNTGKSAIGNLLLHRGESDVFQEACIRETSQPQEAKIDEETLIIDLPGLGSVLCEEDDAIVRNIIRRANLLLLVLDISYPIPRHLYDFLKSSEIIKAGSLQRIVIVINKIDCLSDLPENIKQKQIQKYIDFLKYGNQKMEFEGISNLFNYEIHIIPFSVMEARRKLNIEREYQLRRVIEISLKANANTAINRAEYQLLEVAIRYLPVIASYSVMLKKIQDLSSRMTSTIQVIYEKIAESFEREVTIFLERCASIHKSCFSEMNGYTTDSAERFWRGENFQRKKEKLRKCRDRYQDYIASEFNNLASNLRSNVSIIARSMFGSFQISTPDSEPITSALKSSIYEIWDAFDDYWFLDKEKYTFDRSMEQSSEYLSKANSHLISWLSEFKDSISRTLRYRIEEVNLYQELMYYKSLADPLESFCEEFISIDYFQQAFLSNQ
ncbi:GTPase [Sphaerospermopsis aphanizomenoides]|uniref:GTPase n=1 Tax=Sphaerospermopsis aphanizomenoides TaxID=459663 RepID=UPI001905416E|nr:GTPase [Sphaerospermopsis aphanizomenoides]